MRHKHSELKCLNLASVRVSVSDIIYAIFCINKLLIITTKLQNYRVENIKDKLKTIKLFAMDVDGTLTDGSMYYSSEGEALKKFSVYDGMGITLLHKYGIQTAFITSKDSKIAQKRAEVLNVQHIYIGCWEKEVALKEISQKMNISPEAMLAPVFLPLAIVFGTSTASVITFASILSAISTVLSVLAPSETIIS